ncbi:MAG: hypothetical protein KAW17_13635 [Candidatus Eisenbacteria sp.]|nr:hypothetical protein [Candidatus Eisenbacteria bacterium]
MMSGTPPLSPTAAMDPCGAITQHYLHHARSDSYGQKTTFVFDLPMMEEVTLDVRSNSGHLIKSIISERRAHGRHVVTWDNTDDAGNKVPTGTYFLRMTAGAFTASSPFAVK